MERGRIVQQGTAEELRAAPVSDFVAGFAASPTTWLRRENLFSSD
jgi:ABC-type proline/glycine betaine transport system ATPase subunit